MEHRAFSLQRRGKTLHGTAIRYGEISHVKDVGAERFLPGAFAPLPADIVLNLQHDDLTPVSSKVLLHDSQEALRMSAEVRQGSAAGELVRRGSLKGLSVSFTPLKQRRSHGIRTIERARLEAIALCDRPAYPGASDIELRAGRHGSVNFQVRSGKKYGCRCAKDCTEAEFESGSLDSVTNEETRPANLIAGYGSSFVDRPIASTRRGTLSVRPDGDGGLAGTILLPDAQVYGEMLNVDRAAGLSVRPVIDMVNSTFREVGKVAVYSTVATRGIVVAATGEDRGWREDYELSAPDIENRQDDLDPINAAWAYLI